jgi:hypothetical protein
MRTPRHLAEFFLEVRIGNVLEIVGVSVNILAAVSHYVT